MADDQLTPEQKQAALDFAFKLPTESDIVKQQLARAKALRDTAYQPPPAYGGGGGILAGLATGIRRAGGQYRQGQAEDRMRDIAAEQQKKVSEASPYGGGAPGMQPDELASYAPSHELPAGDGPPSAPPMVGADTSQPGQQFVGYGLGYQPAGGAVAPPDPSQMGAALPQFMGQGISDVLDASGKAMAPGMAQLSQPFGM